MHLINDIFALSHNTQFQLYHFLVLIHSAILNAATGERSIAKRVAANNTSYAGQRVFAKCCLVPGCKLRKCNGFAELIAEAADADVEQR